MIYIFGLLAPSWLILVLVPKGYTEMMVVRSAEHPPLIGPIFY